MVALVQTDQPGGRPIVELEPAVRVVVGAIERRFIDRVSQVASRGMVLQLLADDPVHVAQTCSHPASFRAAAANRFRA